MRLIKTKLLELSEFVGSDIPPYAILSHTWGEGEVSFQEMERGDAQSKPGYDKIRRCCETAIADGFEYAWIDTCCIDKSSSAELTEAINSMYPWYKNADVCYVYLVDVDSHGYDISVPGLKIPFGGCRWFSRGWTLQELIAPKNVIFYDSEWRELGTKQNLRKVISEVTGIGEDVLDVERYKGWWSVAQRMSWAANRETTREEDLAYCLLGLFDINMPMLYGEGKRAFIRLQEEIMRKSTDHSIFAWEDREREDEENEYGLLAPYPACFRDSGNIIHREAMRTSPFSMTNSGIQLNVPLKTEAQGRGVERKIAVLDCEEVYSVGVGLAAPSATSTGLHIGIYLHSSNRTGSTRGNFFERSGQGLARVKKEEIPQLQSETIFVNDSFHRSIAEPPAAGFLVDATALERDGMMMQDSWPVLNSTRPTNKKELGFDNCFLRATAAIRFVGAEGEGFIVVVTVLEHTLSAKVIELASGSLKRIVEGLDTVSRQYYNWLRKGEYSDRVIWQHPVGKWWISVAIKTRIVLGDRVKVLTVNWHVPTQISEMEIQHAKSLYLGGGLHPPLWWVFMEEALGAAFGSSSRVDGSERVLIEDSLPSTYDYAEDIID